MVRKTAIIVVGLFFTCGPREPAPRWTQDDVLALGWYAYPVNPSAYQHKVVDLGAAAELRFPEIFAVREGTGTYFRLNQDGTLLPTAGEGRAADVPRLLEEFIRKHPVDRPDMKLRIADTRNQFPRSAIILAETACDFSKELGREHIVVFAVPTGLYVSGEWSEDRLFNITSESGKLLGRIPYTIYPNIFLGMHCGQWIPGGQDELVVLSESVGIRGLSATLDILAEK